MGSGRTPDTGVKRSVPVTVRLSEREAQALESQRVERRFVTASAYIRHLIATDKGEAREEG